MNIERIAAHLLARNTPTPDLRQELFEPDSSMEKVLMLIASEWSVNSRLHDLYGWVYNERACKRFDVYLNNYNGNGKNCTFGYVDSLSVTQDAENSDEAIRNYSI